MLNAFNILKERVYQTSLRRLALSVGISASSQYLNYQCYKYFSKINGAPPQEPILPITRTLDTDQKNIVSNKM